MVNEVNLLLHLSKSLVILGVLITIPDIILDKFTLNLDQNLFLIKLKSGEANRLRGKLMLLKRACYYCPAFKCEPAHLLKLKNALTRLRFTHRVNVAVQIIHVHRTSYCLHSGTVHLQQVVRGFST